MLGLGMCTAVYFRACQEKNVGHCVRVKVVFRKANCQRCHESQDMKATPSRRSTHASHEGSFHNVNHRSNNAFHRAPSLGGAHSECRSSPSKTS